MPELASLLEAGPHLDDELTDLESRFVEMHGRYTKLWPRYRPQGEFSGERGLARSLYAPPHGELAGELAELRGERSALIRAFAKLPDWPPKPKLLAERIRREVNAAVDFGNGLEAMRARLYKFYASRCDGLRAQRSLVLGRLGRFVRGRTATRRVHTIVNKHMRMLQRDLESSEARLRHLEVSPEVPKNLPVAKSSTGEELFWKSSPYDESTLSSVFRSDVVVCLRAEITEERVTRLLRRFLDKMQHLPISHRWDIWRRALSLEEANLQTTRASGSDEPVLPHTMPSRIRLQERLSDLGLKFNIKTSLRSDDGHLFTHTVLVEFPRIFEQQARHLRFQVYPSASTRQSGSGGNNTDRMAKHDKTYLKNSAWLPMVILHPHVDAMVAEQRELFRAACEPTGEKTSRDGNSVKARVTGAAGGRGLQSEGGVKGVSSLRTSGRDKSSTHSLDGEDGTRSKSDGLHAEIEFLRSDNAQPAMNHIADLAARRSKACAANAANGPSRDVNVDATVPDQLDDDEAFACLAHASSHSYPPQQLFHSYYLLRYLRCRELRCTLLGLLNRFRYVQQRIAYSVLEGHSRNGTAANMVAHSSASDPSGTSALSSQDYGGNRSHHSCSPILPSVSSPRVGALPVSVREALRVLTKFERLKMEENGEISVIDEHGLKVLHEAALGDLEAIEDEMATIGNHFAKGAGSSDGTSDAGSPSSDVEPRGDVPMVDYADVLLHIYEAEVSFHQAKWGLLEPYIEILEHVADPTGQQAIAQRVLDVMAFRPWFDLEGAYFAETYVSTIAALRDRAKLLKSIVAHQIQIERQISAHVGPGGGDGADVRNDNQKSRGSVNPQLDLSSSMSHPGEGLPSNVFAGLMISATPSSSVSNVDLLEIFGSLGLAWQVDVLIEDACKQLVDTLMPSIEPRNGSGVAGRRAALARAVVAVVAVEWRSQLQARPEHLLVPDDESDDVLGCDAVGDPAWLMCLIEEAVENVPAVFGDPGDLVDHEDSKKRVRITDERLDTKELRNSFSEFTAYPYDERVLRLYLNLLEHVTVRRYIADTILELRHLETVLVAQASLVNAHVSFVAEPLAELGDLGTSMPAKPSTSASLLSAHFDAEFGQIDLSSAHAILFNCCSTRLMQMRAIYQHEFSNRWLYTICALYNTVLLDDHMVRQVAEEVSAAAHVSTADANEIRCLRKSFGMSSPANDDLRAFLDKSHQRRSINSASPGSREKTPDPTADKRKKALITLGIQCQFPMLIKTTVRMGIQQILRDRLREFKHRLIDLEKSSQADNNATGGSPSVTIQRQRIIKSFKARFLSHFSIYCAEAACELAVRVQAARTAQVARDVFALVPPEFSPFRFSTEATPRVLVFENGSMGSVFHIPRPIELLSLRGVSVTPVDIVRSVLKVDAGLPDLMDQRSGEVMPQLELDYAGPAYVAFLLLQAMVPLVSVFFFWNGIRGDRTVLLKHHHTLLRKACNQNMSAKSVACVLTEKPITQHDDEDAEAEPRSAAEETWDAMESIRVDFMNLTSQLKGIKANHADVVISFLRDRLRAAAWRTELLLRLSVQPLFDKRLEESVAEVRRWQRFLEGYSLDGSDEIVQLQTAGKDDMEGDQVSNHSTPGRCDGIAPDRNVIDALDRFIATRPVMELLPTGLLCVGPPGDVAAEGRKTPGQPATDGRRLCPYLHPFVHALLAKHSPAVLESDITMEERSEPAKNRPPPSSGGTVPPNSGGAVTASRAFSGAVPPSPFWGRAPWRLPELPLLGLTRGLCLLPVEARSVIAEVNLRLEMQADAYLVLKEVSSKSPEAVHMESELVQTFLVQSRLRDIMLCAQLRAPLPVSGKNAQEFNEHYDRKIEKPKIMRRQMEALQGGGGVSEFAESAIQASIRMQGAIGFDRAEDEHPMAGLYNVNDDFERQTIREDVRDAEDTIARLIGEITKFLLSFCVASFAQHISEVEHVATLHSQHKQDAESKTLSDVSTSLNASRNNGSHSKDFTAITKAEAVAVFNRVRARGSRVRTHGLCGIGSSYVIRERDLEECFEELGKRLLQWGRAAHSAQTMKSRAAIAQIMEPLRQAHRQSLQGRWDATFRGIEFESEVTSTIADQGRKQLYEVDRLHFIMNELATASYEMEHRLSAEIRTKVLQELGVLEKQLQDVQGRFGQYLGEMRNSVADEVRHIRETLLDKLLRLGSTNVVLQQKAKALQEEDHGSAGATQIRQTMGQAAGVDERTTGVDLSTAALKRIGPAAINAGLSRGPRDQIEQLHNEINDLAKTATKLDAMHREKFQSLRQDFEQQLQGFRTALSSNADLWERGAAVRERERVMEDELAHSKRRVSAANDITEKLVGQADLEAEKSQRFEAWKSKAFERFQTLMKEERKYERVDNFDIDRLDHDLKKLDEEIFKLSRNPNGMAGQTRTAERVEAELNRADVQQTILRRKRATEQKLTMKARAKADLIRREVECGEVVDDESVIGLLVEEYRTICKEIATMEVDNGMLRSTLPVKDRGTKRRAVIGDKLAPTTLKKLQDTILRQPEEVEKLCYSIGYRKTLRTPLFRSQVSQIDSARGGGAKNLASLPEVEQRSGADSNGGRRPASQKEETMSLRSAVGEIASELGRLRDSTGATGARTNVVIQPAARAVQAAAFGRSPEYFVNRFTG